MFLHGNVRILAFFFGQVSAHFGMNGGGGIIVVYPKSASHLMDGFKGFRMQWWSPCSRTDGEECAQKKKLYTDIQPSSFSGSPSGAGYRCHHHGAMD